MTTKGRNGRVFLTKHVIERFQERFPHHCKDMSLYQVREFIYSFIGDADNNRSFINNTNFMQHLYKRYGTKCRYEFLVKEDVVFAMVVEPSRKVAVTCLERAGVRFLKETKKFKPRQEKKIKLTRRQEESLKNSDFDDFLTEIKKKKAKKVYF